MQCITMACSIALWLSSAGWHDPQIRAVVSVVQEESGFEPCVVSRDGAHEGLFQWRNPRRAALHAWARTRGCVAAESQVRFMVAELGTRPEARAFFAATTCAAAKRVLARRYEGRPDRKAGCR